MCVCVIHCHIILYIHAESDILLKLPMIYILIIHTANRQLVPIILDPASVNVTLTVLIPTSTVCEQTNLSSREPLNVFRVLGILQTLSLVVRRVQLLDSGLLAFGSGPTLSMVVPDNLEQQ